MIFLENSECGRIASDVRYCSINGKFSVRLHSKGGLVRGERGEFQARSMRSTVALKTLDAYHREGVVRPFIYPARPLDLDVVAARHVCGDNSVHRLKVLTIATIC